MRLAVRGRAGSEEHMGCRSRQMNRQTDERTMTQTDLINSGDLAEPELQEVKIPCLLVSHSAHTGGHPGEDIVFFPHSGVFNTYSGLGFLIQFQFSWINIENIFFSCLLLEVILVV